MPTPRGAGDTLRGAAFVAQGGASPVQLVMREVEGNIAQVYDNHMACNLAKGSVFVVLMNGKLICCAHRLSEWSFSLEITAKIRISGNDRIEFAPLGTRAACQGFAAGHRLYERGV